MIEDESSSRSHGTGEPELPESSGLTLEQVGARAGVSRSTVSRVLNGQGDVRPEVRERVERVIRETGYRPNQAARALASSRTGVIGLVMLADVDELFGDPYYSALVRGINSGCQDHGLVFAMFPLYGPDHDTELLTRQIAQSFLDGVIVTASPRSEALIAALSRSSITMVVVGQPNIDEGVLRIDVDNRGGMEAATHQLVASGRERIGFVGTPPEFSFGTQRFQGYRDALESRGRSVNPEWVSTEDPTIEGGFRGALALIDKGVDALVVASDTIAVGVYRAIGARRLQIPTDIAVVSFDGLPNGPTFDPTLTTVIQPVDAVGRQAVEMLMNPADAPPVTVLATTLSVRGSSR